MTYLTEFPDFPEADLPAIPPSWSDLSWHNDACPFFLITGSLGVWVDYSDHEASDFGPARDGRFGLVPMIDAQYPVDGAEPLLVTDDWQALLAKAIGVSFVAALKAQLEPDEFEQMRQRNVKRPQGVCHSHDFCDANMPMASAFEAVMGREPDPAQETDAALWSAAWEGAMPDLTASGDLARAAKALAAEARDWQIALGEGARPSLDRALRDVDAALTGA